MSTKCKLTVPLYKASSGYSYYKELILSWSDVTETPDESKGIRVALSFNDIDPKLCEKIFTNVTRQNLKQKDGFEQLIAFLDKELGKDALEEIVCIYDEFEDCRRQDGESVNVYISNFDQKSSLLKAKGIKLPSEILGFKLLRGAGLTREERVLVLSGVDYDQKNTLYEQAKKSLKKFKGEGSGGTSSGAVSGAGCSLGPSHSSNTPAIKVEPTYYAGSRGGYRAAGAGSQNRPSYRGNFGWRGMRPPGNDSWRGMRNVVPQGDSWRGGRPESWRGTSRGNFMQEPWRGSSRGNFSWRDSGNARSSKPWQGSSQRKSYNPFGVDGVQLTCDCCRSICHLLKDCPHSWEKIKNVNVVDDVSDNVYEGYYGAYGGEEYGDVLGSGDTYDDYVDEFAEHVVLFTGSNPSEALQLELEAHNSAVLDSACSSTVCGKAWLEDFLLSRDPNDQRPIVKKLGSRFFQFGAGNRMKSEGEYDLPVHLAGYPVVIKTDVVDSDIPLLLSKNAMKRAGVVLDTANDSALILGKEVSLNCTSSGHYCVPIVKSGDVAVECALAVDLQKYSSAKVHDVLLKLHRSMGHPREAKLISFLKDANSWREEYSDALSSICTSCVTCKKFSRTPSRPVVALPMASRFNEKVAMDLKDWNSRWILHLIDMWSRYTISVFVSRKTKETIIDNVILHWIGYFGVMGTILSDNGGEFRNDEMREVCSVLNVEVLTTAAESPFQNGLCEKNHAVTDMILHKLTHDFSHIRPEVLLRWANMTKNTLQMWNGYSSNQLVFGINPHLPNVFGASLPALEEETVSRTLADHLNILHESRKAFIETEASERIKRALRNRVRSSETVYKNGDKVFYKRDRSLRWLGPAKVVFQDRKIVLLDHGGYYIKVSPNRLVKVEDQFKDGVDKVVEPPGQNSAIEELSDDGSIVGVLERPVIPLDDPVIDLLDNQLQIQPDLNHSVNQFEELNHEDHDTAVPQVESEPSRRSLRLFNKESGYPVYPVYITTIPRNQQNNSVCTQAKLVELQKLKDFDVYDEVPFNHQECISTRWVLWYKGECVRARLVARGFEESSIVQKDSPTVGKVAVRVFMSISVSKGWCVKTTDIKSAFLQGNPLDREVHIVPPKEASVQSGKVWKLKTCLYGLNDAARKFYDSVVLELKRLGCKQSSCNPALFFFKKNSELCGILVTHIDDFLHSGNDIFEVDVLSKLRHRFIAGKLMEGDFSYVGFQVHQDQHGVVVNQSNYVENLKLPVILSERMLNRNDELTTEEYTIFRRVVGCMNWMAHGTRPDILFDLIELSMKFQKAYVDDLVRAVKLARKLRDVDSHIVFPALSSDPSLWKMYLFTDAALGNLLEGIGSTGAYLIFLVDLTGKCCILEWKCNKIKRVVRSTLAAEALSLQDGIEDAIYLRSMLKELIDVNVPIQCYIDNKSTVDAVNSTQMVDDKRLRRDIAAIKQELSEGLIDNLIWIADKQQLANCLTKKGASNIQLLTVLHSGNMPELPHSN